VNQFARRVPAGGRGQATEDSGTLLRGRFLTVMVLTFFAFGIDNVLRPVVPLLVVARGGDATLVGIIAAAYALPAVLFRPMIGWLVDRGSHGQLLRLGALAACIGPIGLMLPGIATLAAVRFLQGTAFSMYSVSTRTLMAMLAPAAKRGEASGYYAAMPALGSLIGPALGTALYLATGEIGPVLLATAFAAIGVALTRRARIDDTVRVVEEKPTGPIWAEMLRFVERSSLPALLMLTCFQTTQAFFTVFPPIYVLATGQPIEVLVFYYPVVGLLWAGSQLVSGRVSDRLGRGRTIRLACSIAVAGLAVPIVFEGLIPFAVAAFGYTIGFALVSPALSALAIDRAPTERLGSAMATYSMGHGLAATISSVTWGALIATQGFAVAFAAGIVLQLLTFGLSYRFTTSR
jgi:MFS family permease